MLEKYSLARVVSVNRNKYVITSENGNIFAETSGSFTYSNTESTEKPATGDWVQVEYQDNKSFAVIHKIAPRKTVLKRKVAGKETKIQLIATNIDYAFIVQSVDFNLNIKRLERYLVMINESKIKPIILLSKCDLIAEEKVQEIKNLILDVIPNAQIIAFSNLDTANIDMIKNLLQKDKTYCLLGSSGVGKTTLLNNILGEDRHKTQAVSKKENKGKHTTTRRELTVLESGANIIDTPGMRELSNVNAEEGLEETFFEITEAAKQCKFSDCSHLTENSCAVLAAVKAEEISFERYENYIRIKAESVENSKPIYKKKANKSLRKQTQLEKKKKYKKR